MFTLLPLILIQLVPLDQEDHWSLPQLPPVLEPPLHFQYFKWCSEERDVREYKRRLNIVSIETPNCVLDVMKIYDDGWIRNIKNDWFFEIV